MFCVILAAGATLAAAKANAKTSYFSVDSVSASVESFEGKGSVNPSPDNSMVIDPAAGMPLSVHPTSAPGVHPGVQKSEAAAAPKKKLMRRERKLAGSSNKKKAAWNWLSSGASSSAAQFQYEPHTDKEV